MSAAQTYGSNVPLLTSIAVVRRHFPLIAQEEVVQRIDGFLDYSTQYDLFEACYTSLELAKRIFARRGRDQKEIVSLVVVAVKDGDLDEVKLFCRLGKKITGLRVRELLNCQDEWGWLAVGAAARTGSRRVLKWLVRKGARLDEKDREGMTALHRAAHVGHLSIVRWIVENGVGNLDEKDTRGCTALHYAAWGRHRRVVKWLIENGASIHETDAEGCVVLHEAARGGSLRVVKLLVKKGAGVNYADTTGQTPMHVATSCGRLRVANFLVKNGAHALAVDLFGCSAIYYAMSGHNFPIAESVLKICSNDKGVCSPSDLWETLLSAAATDQIRIIVQLHEKFGVDIGSSLRNGRTALHEAAKGGAIHAVRLLLNAGLDICQPDGFGSTPIIEACRQGHLDVLDHVIKSGGNVTDVDFTGRTSLHYAAEGGFDAVVGVLLAQNANINFSDGREWTPLHCAAAAGHLEVVELLVTHGAIADSKTISGMTAFALATERGHPKVAQVLEGLTPPQHSDEAKILDNFVEYFLNPSDIIFEPSEYQSKFTGLWLDSPIEVKVKQSWSLNFVEELSRWSPLNHPHVVKLYGVCHGDGIEEPYFVFERAIQGSLFEYTEKLGKAAKHSELWEKLYEAALGLQYLHDHNIVHCDFSCDSIVVAENGTAKLRNLGRENETRGANLGWKAPEVLSGLPHSFESDIFAFGMTIVQAVKLSWDPWNALRRGMSREKTVLSGRLPDIPPGMTAVQYNLVQRMCSYNPRDRPSASDVVRELEVFTRDSSYISFSEDRQLESMSNSDNDQTDEASVLCILTEIEDMGEASASPNFMIRGVYERLIDLFDQLKERREWSARAYAKKFGSIVRLFHERFQRPRAIRLGTVARIAANRLGIDDIFSMHTELDVFMEKAKLSGSKDSHIWRSRLEFHRQQQSDEMMDNLSALLEKEGKNTDEASDISLQLNYELSRLLLNSKTSNAGDDLRLEAVSTLLPTLENASWFIPAYEVLFDHFDEFSHGAFGKVYHGRWKRSRVVVKKVELRNRKDHTVFLNEVAIWHKLYHPHVVQLFGASHIDQPFFLCEYAGGGQLDDYLRVHPDELWEKLYEAALGLRYLHMKRVVHSDLKCNNILIGSDGRAKLTDFGLSTFEISPRPASDEPEAEEKSGVKLHVGAIRWKAPEILRGEKAMFASDVYSFGMCILEAVSGKYPWGMAIPDNAVIFHVLKRQSIPQRPANCNGDAYQLVKRMCRFDPNKRLGIKEVVNALNAFQE